MEILWIVLSFLIALAVVVIDRLFTQQALRDLDRLKSLLEQPDPPAIAEPLPSSPTPVSAPVKAPKRDLVTIRLTSATGAPLGTTVIDRRQRRYHHPGFCES